MFDLYPAWKQATKDIVDGGLEPGRVLTKEALMKALQISEPKTIDEFKGAQLAFVDGFCRLKEALLTDHFVDLETVPGIGYRVIEPGRQTRLAMKDGAKAITKAMRNTGRRLICLDKTALSAEERRESDDAVAKFSRLQGLIGRPSRLLALTLA